MKTADYTLNVGGRLMSLSEPQVMGILNLTPDSFYAQSRSQTEADVRRRARQIVDEGGSIIDVGACSTRPGSTPATEAEEMERLRWGLSLVREELPDAVLSVDTFRASVAKMCVEQFGAAIVNDVTGGEADSAMFPTVAKLGVPYVLTFPRAGNVCVYFAERLQQLRDLGQKDIVLDPGFGFGKTVDENYQLLAHLSTLRIFELPLLIGISRKRMVYELLGTSPDEALNGTTVLHTLCLQTDCAQILRVHDVRQAVEAVKVKITQKIRQ